LNSIFNPICIEEECDQFFTIDDNMEYQKNNVLAGKTTGQENVGANIKSI
jgi:hypothetical protein